MTPELIFNFAGLIFALFSYAFSSKQNGWKAFGGILWMLIPFLLPEFNQPGGLNGFWTILFTLTWVVIIAVVIYLTAPLLAKKWGLNNWVGAAFQVSGILFIGIIAGHSLF